MDNKEKKNVKVKHILNANSRHIIWELVKNPTMFEINCYRKLEEFAVMNTRNQGSFKITSHVWLPMASSTAVWSVVKTKCIGGYGGPWSWFHTLQPNKHLHMLSCIHHAVSSYLWHCPCKLTGYKTSSTKRDVWKPAPMLTPTVVLHSINLKPSVKPSKNFSCNFHNLIISSLFSKLAIVLFVCLFLFLICHPCEES